MWGRTLGDPMTTVVGGSGDWIIEVVVPLVALLDLWLGEARVMPALPSDLQMEGMNSRII